MYYVYILTNRYNKVLYTGVTNDLSRRYFEHLLQVKAGFTQRYNVNKLVYYEIFQHMNDAISREKAIKGKTRVKKISLVEAMNPNWEDLLSV